MTKIDIISGFLGAGKTTFIKKMLQDAFAGEQVVLIENEFGEIGIDGGFLKDSGIEIREMNSGCICCSLVGDFGKSLKEVVGTYHPDRILIEPSGVGKLSDVMKAVQDVQGEIDAELNSFTTVVDAMKCRLYRNNFGEFFSNQVEYAGAVILSRTDKADLEKVRESCQIIRELNKRAPIITTPIMELTGEKLLETMEQGKSLEEELLADMMRPGYGEQHGHGKACGCRHEHDADGEAGQPHGEHGEDCGCGGKHHDGGHGEERGCGGKHHDGGHGEDCGCGGKHHDGGHGEDCGCGGKHHDGSHEGHVHGEGCGCRHGHHGDGHEGQGHHGHGQDHGHHHAEEVFTSWGYETVKVFTKEEINQILDSLESDESYGTVLRAKGMVEGNGGWIYFDMVPKEHEVRSGAAEYTGRICVIGSDLKADMLETLFGVK